MTDLQIGHHDVHVKRRIGFPWKFEELMMIPAESLTENCGASKPGNGASKLVIGFE